MADTYLDPGGIVIPESALKLRRSRETVRALNFRNDVYAKLVECRKSPSVETVIIDIEPQRPQLATTIKKIERVAAVFPETDHTYPEVLSLRSDFPQVQHLNQREVDFPRSFCLYDRPWPEIRVNWTGPTFIERIRWWLAGTARGTLHADDQPLEPLLLSPGYWLVLPRDLPAPMTPCAVSFVDHTDPTVLVVRELPLKPGKNAIPPHLILRIESPPRIHGTSPRAPKTLKDLCELLSTPDFDLLGVLRSALRKWPEDRESELAARIVLLIDLPKVRVAGGPIVTTDRKAFLTIVNGFTLGAAVGVWTVKDRKRGMHLTPDPAAVGETVELVVTNVTYDMTPQMAAFFTGTETHNDIKVTAVGAGALGSQTILNLARAGLGHWTIIDNDRILPHNLARHALNGFAVGIHKARALAATMNSLFDPPIATAINADVLNPGKDTASVEAALTGSELQLDMSASVPVARHLAHGPGHARRMSVFLSPSGRDLVMLCEDNQRSITLDKLEMSYYAAVASDERLNGHIDLASGRNRYGLSCRDITSTMSQADVATFAGIAARAIPQAVAQENALIRVWRSDPASGAVSVVNIDVDRWHTRKSGDWTIHISEQVRTLTAQWRLERLPRETGGILMGAVDHDRQSIYVSTPLPSPPDSVEWPTLYIRGNLGMREKVEQILEHTAANMVYVGEWHSHPRSHPTLPSSDDLGVLASVAEWVNPAGQPGLIMIAGDDGHARVLIEGFDSTNPPEETCPA